MAYVTSLSEATGKRGLFNYLEGYRQLFLRTGNNEWLKANTKKATSLRLSPDSRSSETASGCSRGQSKYSVGVYDKITADNWEHKGMLLPLRPWLKGVYAISICLPSPWGLMIISPWCQWFGQMQEPAEFVEDRVGKTAEYQRDHYDFWYKILSDESKDKLFRSVLVYDSLVGKDGKKDIGLQLMTKNHWL